MAIEFVCPTCRGTLRVGDDTAGRVVRCGGCMTMLRVPAAAGEPTPPPARDPRDPQDAPDAPPSPFENPLATSNPNTPPDDPPVAAAAEPVEPPRSRDRDRDSDDPYDRPRRDRDSDDDKRPRRTRRRRPPPPPGRGVFFWLVLIGGLFLLGTVGCCGGIFLMLPGPKWEKHESQKGGFKVDLPAPPRNDLDKLAGEKPDPNMTVEGTILTGRLEEYAIVYGDIQRDPWRQPTDEQRIEEAVQSLRTDKDVKEVIRQDKMTVSGFPAREIELRDKAGGWYTARIIITDTRVYVLVAGGKFAKPGNENVKRFLDSFEITDPRLKAVAQKRADDARKVKEDADRAVAEAARQKQEREEREAAAALARERGRVRDAGALAARETFEVVEEEQQVLFRAIEVAAQVLRDLHASAALAAQTSINVGDTTRQAALQAIEALRESAALAVKTSVEIGDLESRKTGFAYGPGRYAGHPVPAPNAVADPVFHLTFDDSRDQSLTVAPSGKTITLPKGAEFGPGVRGTAVYLTPETKIDISKLAGVEALNRRDPVTISAWVKTTSPETEVFRFIYDGNNRWAGHAIRLTDTDTFALDWFGNAERPQARLAKLVAPSIADGRWHHVAFVKQEITNVVAEEHTALYVDGKRVARTAMSGGWDRTAKLTPSVIASVLGRRVGETDGLPNFAIDELCVFPEALNEVAIRRLAGFEPLPAAPAPHAVTPLTVATAGARLPFHTAAVFDTGRDELWLVGSAGIEQFGAKATSPFLYRYSLPELKLTGKYELPEWGYRAVLDAKEHRLYVAVSPAAKRGRFPNGPFSGEGGIHLFDLARLEKNDGKNPPFLKTAGDYSPAGTYTDLALSADGKYLYAAQRDKKDVTVHRHAANLLGKPKSLALTDARPDARFAVGADGAVVVVTGADRGGIRFEIDPDAWTATRTDRLGWGGASWVVTPAGRVFATRTTQTYPEIQGVLMHDTTGANYGQAGPRGQNLALSPGGRCLFVNDSPQNGFQTGFAVYRADADWSPDGLMRLAPPLGEKIQGSGPMVLSGDGRWLVFQSGTVVKVTYGSTDSVPDAPPPATIPPRPVPPAPPRLPVPGATTLPGLAFYLPCDELTNGQVKDAVSGKWFGKSTKAELVDGPRGKSLRLTSERSGEKAAVATPGLDLSDAAERLRVAEGKPFTFAFWVRQESQSIDTFGNAVLSFEHQAPEGRRMCSFNYSQGELRMSLVKQTPADKPPVQLKGANASEPVCYNRWVHVAVTRDSRGVVQLNLDGVAVRMQGGSIYDAPFDFATLVLGRSGFEKLSVEIDELCLFDRALTTEEVTFLAGRKGPYLVPKTK